MQAYKVFDIKKDEIIPIAEKLRKENRRLVMITGHVDKDGQNVVSYHFEIGDTIETHRIIGEEVIPTLSHIYDLAAAWPEEELTELMNLTFEGLIIKERLFMPENMLEGKGHILVTPLKELREKNLGKKED